jgi:hypothetical protein
MKKHLWDNYKVLSNKLKDYFKDNIRLALKTEDKMFIITKSGIFYLIKIYQLFNR